LRIRISSPAPGATPRRIISKISSKGGSTVGYSWAAAFVTGCIDGLAYPMAAACWSAAVCWLQAALRRRGCLHLIRDLRQRRRRLAKLGKDVAAACISQVCSDIRWCTGGWTSAGCCCATGAGMKAAPPAAS
jgi:hypothetical protein